jgi:hypothetical protein
MKVSEAISCSFDYHRINSQKKIRPRIMNAFSLNCALGLVTEN